MAGEISGVKVKIGADNSGLKKGVKDSKRSISELRKSANQAAKSLALYGAAATAAGAAVSVALFKGSAEAAKEIKNLAQVSNESAEAFQKQASAASTVGIDMGKFGDILKDVNDRVGDFVTTGGGPMADFFEKIAPKVGVTAQQFKNLSGKDALQLYVDSLEKANVNQQEMTFFLEAMSSNATALLPLLKNGGEGFAEMAEHTESLGLALSDVDVEKLAMADTQIKQLASRFDSAARQVSAKFAPALDIVSKAVDQFIIDSGGMDKVAAKAFDGIVEAAGFAADAVDGVGRVFEITARGINGVLGGVIGTITQIARGWLMLSDTIPGVDMSKQIAQLQEFERINLQMAVDTLSDANDILMDQRPSEVLKERIALAKEANDLAAKAVVSKKIEKKDKDSGNLEDAEAEKRKAAQAKELEELTAFLESKAAIVEENNALALIAADNNMLIDDLRRSEQEQKEIDSLQRIFDSNQSHERKVSALKNASAKARNAIAISEGRNALSVIAQFNKSAFKANKAFAISDALISTYQGIAAALRLPFPANIAAAASTAAKGFAQVSNIKSQSFGGGGAGGSAASGGGGAGFSPVSQSGTGSSGEAQQTQNINISGISATDLISGGQLVTVLNEAIGDGATITGIN